MDKRTQKGRVMCSLAQCPLFMDVEEIIFCADCGRAYCQNHGSNHRCSRKKGKKQGQPSLLDPNGTPYHAKSTQLGPGTTSSNDKGKEDMREEKKKKKEQSCKSRAPHQTEATPAPQAQAAVVAPVVAQHQGQKQKHAPIQQQKQQGKEDMREEKKKKKEQSCKSRAPHQTEATPAPQAQAAVVAPVVAQHQGQKQKHAPIQQQKQQGKEDMREEKKKKKEQSCKSRAPHQTEATPAPQAQAAVVAPVVAQHQGQKQKHAPIQQQKQQGKEDMREEKKKKKEQSCKSRGQSQQKLRDQPHMPAPPTQAAAAGASEHQQHWPARKPQPMAPLEKQPSQQWLQQQLQQQQIQQLQEQQKQLQEQQKQLQEQQKQLKKQQEQMQEQQEKLKRLEEQDKQQYQQTQWMQNWYQRYGNLRKKQTKQESKHWKQFILEQTQQQNGNGAPDQAPPAPQEEVAAVVPPQRESREKNTMVPNSAGAPATRTEQAQAEPVDPQPVVVESCPVPEEPIEEAPVVIEPTPQVVVEQQVQQMEDPEQEELQTPSPQPVPDVEQAVKNRSAETQLQRMGVINGEAEEAPGPWRVSSTAKTSPTIVQVKPPPCPPVNWDEDTSSTSTLHKMVRRRGKLLWRSSGRKVEANAINVEPDKPDNISVTESVPEPILPVPEGLNFIRDIIYMSPSHQDASGSGGHPGEGSLKLTGAQILGAPRPVPVAQMSLPDKDNSAPSNKRRKLTVSSNSTETANILERTTASPDSSNVYYEDQDTREDDAEASGPVRRSQKGSSRLFGPLEVFRRSRSWNSEDTTASESTFGTTSSEASDANSNVMPSPAVAAKTTTKKNKREGKIPMSRSLKVKLRNERLKKRVLQYVKKYGPNDHSGVYFTIMAKRLDHSGRTSLGRRISSLHKAYLLLLSDGFIVPMP